MPPKGKDKLKPKAAAAMAARTAQAPVHDNRILQIRAAMLAAAKAAAGKAGAAGASEPPAAEKSRRGQACGLLQLQYCSVHPENTPKRFSVFLGGACRPAG